MTDPFKAMVRDVVAEVKESVVPRGEHVYEAELVAALGTRERARRLIKDGTVAGSIIGHRIIADRASFDAYVRAHRVRVKASEEAVTDKQAALAEAVGKVFRKVG